MSGYRNSQELCDGAAHSTADDSSQRETETEKPRFTEKRKQRSRNKIQKRR